MATPDTPGAWWRGYRLSAVDGTCVDLPDTEANRAAFGGPTGGAFAQIRLVAHCEIGTRCLIDASFDAYATSEKALCEALAPSFAPDMLTIFDAGFCGTDLYATITATGAQVIMRAGAQFALEPVEVLCDGSYTAHLKRGGALVRVIEYTVSTDTDTPHGRQSTLSETITLITSLLDTDRFPIADFPGLYAARWEAEILSDAVKTELRCTTTVRFRSQSPDLLRQEAWALLLLYQALSDLITRAADYTQLDPDRISFTTTLNTARRSVNQTGRRFPPEHLTALDAWAFSELIDDLLPQRRSRSAPRQVTRRSYRFPTRKRSTPASGTTRHRIHIWHLTPPATTP